MFRNRDSDGKSHATMLGNGIPRPPNRCVPVFKNSYLTPPPGLFYNETLVQGTEIAALQGFAAELRPAATASLVPTPGTSDGAKEVRPQ